MTPKKRVEKIKEVFALTKKFFTGALSNGALEELIGEHANRTGNIISHIKFPVRIGEALHQFWLIAWQKGGGLAIHLYDGQDRYQKEIDELTGRWKDYVGKSVGGVEIDTRDGTPHRLCRHYGQPIPDNN